MVVLITASAATKQCYFSSLIWEWPYSSFWSPLPPEVSSPSEARSVQR